MKNNVSDDHSILKAIVYFTEIDKMKFNILSFV